jgi:phosphoketolase
LSRSPENAADHVTDGREVAYHGYPSLIHRLTYRRSGHDKRNSARAYTREQGEAIPEVANWTWPS